jgi:hypothetical protein
MLVVIVSLLGLLQPSESKSNREVVENSMFRRSIEPPGFKKPEETRNVVQVL